jgi:hypothetical protein
MNSIMSKVLGWMKQLGYLAMQYAYTCMYWKVRFFKVQVQKWKKCAVQKKVEKTYTGLGADIYALHKQGETDWQRMPSVQQHLKFCEEAESKVFQVDETIEEINNDYLAKKEEVREKYSAKRTHVSESRDQTPE